MAVAPKRLPVIQSQCRSFEQRADDPVALLIAHLKQARERDVAFVLAEH
jgi:hypothetical protein